MNCKNCKNWVFGRCVVSNLVVGPDMLCNAWELSQSYEMVDMQFATFDEEELHKRIMELEYNAANNAMSMHAIIDMLDIDNETQGFSDDMYKTAHNLAHKLRDRVAELEPIIDKLVEGIDSLTSGFPLEIEYIEAVEVAKDWKKGRE